LGDVKAPVSVVIPCYHCKDTIHCAVQSVAAQSWRPAEVILVDDASDDDTPRVLRALQDRYGNNWVRVIPRQVNGGPGAARNTGWEIATQPYIAFLDADDFWHPRKIEIQLKYMLEHPEIAISGHRYRWLKEGEAIPPLPESYTIKPITRWQMLLSNRLSTITVMLKRSLNFRFEPSKRYSEDYLLWLQIISSGYKATLIDLALAYLYKAPYGAGGLSGQLWKMEKGQLDTYRRLRSEGLISWPVFVGLSALSMAKYLRRVMICKLRAMRDEA